MRISCATLVLGALCCFGLVMDGGFAAMAPARAASSAATGVMTIVITHQPQTALPGHEVFFQVTAAPQGDMCCGGGQISWSATIPKGTTYLPGNGNFKVKDGVISGTAQGTWGFGPGNFNFLVSSDPSQLAGLSAITFSFQIQAGPEFPGTGATYFAGSNQDRVPLSGQPFVEVTASPGDRVHAGGRIQYTVTGQAPAGSTSASVTVTLAAMPSGSSAKASSIDSSSITPGGKVREHSITWPLGVGGQPPALHFALEVSAGLKPLKGVKSFSATPVLSAVVSGKQTSLGGTAAVVKLVQPGPVTVNSTENADAADPTVSPETGVPGVVTLRSAMSFVNLRADPQNTIKFDIERDGINAFDGAIPVIKPPAGLPALAVTVLVDGTTQAGGRVELDGELAPLGTDGLDLTAPGCEVRGLAINHFPGAGIVLQARSEIVGGNLIGTDAAGDGPIGHDLTSGNGIGVSVAAPGSRIGGLTKPDRNVISGNRQAGIQLQVNGTETVVEGNYVGLAANGSDPISNRDGILIYSNGNTIGGTEAGAGNVIGGNLSTAQSPAGTGLHLFTGASGNAVIGNHIGTDAAGEASLPNGFLQLGTGSETAPVGGVVVEGDHNTIGPGNTIAGNFFSDVQILGPAATDNVVQKNLLGVDARGKRALRPDFRKFDITLQPILETSLLLLDASQNTLGGSGGRGNVAVTILLTNDAGGSTQNNVIQGNRIGAGALGEPLQPPRYRPPADNWTPQINLISQSGGTTSQNTIGGSDSGAGNTLAGSQLAAIQLGHSDGNVIQGNFIGADSHHRELGDGLGQDGILLVSSSNTTIGGDDASEGNVIGFCGMLTAVPSPLAGIRLAGGSCDGNRILSNTFVKNRRPAVFIDRSTNGGSDYSVGNSILSNSFYGNGGGIVLEGYTFQHSFQTGTGPNAYLNYPNVLTYSVKGGTVTITGSYVGGPLRSPLILQFFSSARAGDAQKLAGSLSITTDFTGAVDQFSLTLPVASLVAAPGPRLTYITATATDPSGNTSQLAPAQ